MIKLGEKQELVVVKKVDFGAYLAVSEEQAENRVLLPAAQLPEGCKPGDRITVFIYRDSSDRLIATVREPGLVMGQVAELTVAQTGKIGAFLDWGLEKDLLLPFREQRGKVKQGDKVLVSLYVDKSSRLCATMNVYKNHGVEAHAAGKGNGMLQTGATTIIEDMVRGRVYELSDNFGAFVAVDNIYSALISKKELYGDVELGTDVEARVIRVKEDGKLDLSIRKKGLLQLDEDAEKILDLLDSYSGALPFSDKAAPEVIKYETGMSKNEFKRAVGRLLKQGKVEIGEKTIRRVNR